MNFVEQLMRAPAIVAKPKRRKYTRTSSNVRGPDTEGRYRLYLENTPRTIPELAALLGYSYDGTRHTIYRMVARGLVREAGKGTLTSAGRRPMRFVWCGGK